jgi:hypothetical protein
MPIHKLRHGPPCLYAYVSPHYAFVCPGNEVVVYNADTGETLFSVSFDERDFEFTSMVIINTKIFISLADGRLLRLRRQSGTDRYIFDLFDSQAWINAEVFFEPNERVAFLFGGNEEMMFGRTTYNNIVLLRTQSADTTCIRFGHQIEVHNFDQKRNRLFLVSYREGWFVLSVIKPSDEDPTVGCEYSNVLENVPFAAKWKLLAVSKNGEVAFFDRGRFRILNSEQEDAIQPFALGNSLKNNAQVQCCFLGEDDEYFTYCGGFESEIAVAERIHGLWEQKAFLVADTDDVFGLESYDVGVSKIYDPTTDGKRLVVRVGLDRYSWAENECLGRRNPPSMLWAFDMSQRDLLQLSL